jgi:6-phosphogluconolactonase
VSEVPLKPNILASKNLEDWVVLATKIIGEKINSSISSRGVCQLMLTGGNTAEYLYRQWAKSSPFPLERICFLFSDERCVPPDHADSNYAMVMRTLLVYGTPPGCSVTRMQAENPNRETAAKAYEKLIPETLDILLLSVGMDGHIASLFPHDPVILRSRERKVVPIKGPKPPNERLTITPKVIARAKSVFVLAKGEGKGKVLVEALKSNEDILSFPVCLTMGGTWLLDAEAGIPFLKSGMV